ncbi:type II toxin-antitoxin system VapC family toxin [Deinococcus sp. AJ005]|uniref:type II toxin-antitoxin system VapC family toxin n=1 Tax=Deinococcus sp. AJ005 TaxID=2652443 RepID=UPI00125CC9D7|nr:type II toxin-antitoxin system VapC family toxin [Deinococcus sp. AJ005]QFP77591.1 type II toxin-antitoxin system VapC family toxin [Deinococcus sp. AJ005]
MTLLYLDTSALARLYTDEPDHEKVRLAQVQASGDITHAITYVELHSALAGRRQRKAISERAYRAALQDIGRDWPTIRHISVDEQLLQDAAQLATSHTLRASDAVHLAAAQAIAPLGLQFMTFDLKLRVVAEQVLPGQVWQP